MNSALCQSPIRCTDSIDIRLDVSQQTHVKFLLGAICVGVLSLGACRPLWHGETMLSTRVVTSASRTDVTSGTTRTPATTEIPSVTEVSALPTKPSANKLATEMSVTFRETVIPLMIESDKYELGLIADGFQQPVYLTHSIDGSRRLFVVEQGGVIWIIQGGKRLTPPFLDLSDRISRRASEQGLLGLAFDPEYAHNGYLFLHYSDGNGDTVVMRFAVSDDPNRTDPRSGIHVLTQLQPYRNHNGGQIAFGPDGYLYIGMGDGGLAGDPHDNGQNLMTWLGAILRVDVDESPGYALPLDNPFLSNKAAAPEIWVYGLRNPWRFSFDRLTGDLYIGDVGQNDWEEIDFQPAGSRGSENYGWGLMEGEHCYRGDCDSKAYVAPIAEYNHSDGGCSVTGGYVYRGENLKGLQGVYLYGDYCSGLIWGLLQTTPGEWTNRLLIESGLKISSFGEDELGEVYVVDYGGAIYRLKQAVDP